ncbi:MAG: hypothetical protein ABWY19_11825 [Marmoricola sp.]
MSRLVDPTLCPDCRGRLVRRDGGAACASCALEVTGPLAAELWTRMVAADRVVEQLRMLSGSARTPVPDLPSPGTGLPSFPRTTPVATPPRRLPLPAASVPVVLLSLGALCLLVAAVVFVAVAWGSLGLTGRTLVLLGVTTLFAVAAVALTRKDLRGAAETFWLVVAGMLVVDLLGARSSGLLGLDVLDWRGAGALVGTVLLSFGLGVAAWAVGQPVRQLYGAQATAVAGALLLTVTNAWLAEDVALASAVAIPLLAGLAVLVRPLLRLVAVGLVALAGASWLVLAGTGFVRALDDTTTRWWADARFWPLVVASCFAAAVALLPRLDEHHRAAAAGLAIAPLVVLAIAPANTTDPTISALLVSATLLALAGVTRFAPEPWARGAAVLTALGAVALTLPLLTEGFFALVVLPVDVAASIDTPLGDPSYLAAPWTQAVAGIAVTGALVGLLRFADAAGPSLLRVMAPPVLTLGALVAAVGYPIPLWAGVLAAGVAAAAAGAATWTVRDRMPAAAVGGVATAYFVLGMLAAAQTVAVLSALAGTVVALALGLAFAVRETERAAYGPAVLGASTVLAGAYAVDGWARVFAADDTARVLAAAGFAAVVGLLAAPVTRATVSRVALEAAAVVVAMTAVGLAPTDAVAAMVLTVVGSALALVSVLNRDRAHAGWAAALVLGFATVIRVADHVTFPEAYTLPAAAVLIGAGIWRLSTDEDANSFVVLGSGLTLALLPSLLLALDEPVSLRGALVGAGGVAVLLVGLQQRLAAPFALGALTTALLAVRHLEPYADAVPRWISLGAVGVALLLVGVTWEARRRNLETAGRYLAALR